jgi:hypothetical protein
VDELCMECLKCTYIYQQRELIYINILIVLANGWLKLMHRVGVLIKERTF